MNLFKPMLLSLLAILSVSSLGQAGQMTARDGIRLSYQTFEIHNAKGAVVVVPGRSEPAAKYKEVAEDLNRAGYSVYVLDLRGQGESDRLLPDAQIGHVNKFQDYADDLKQFVADVVSPRSDALGVRDLYLLAHSMGGAISALYLEQNNSPFRSVVLSSPMLQVNLAPYPESVARAILEFNLLSGNGRKYVQGTGPYAVATDTFAANKGTHSLERFSSYQKLLSDEPNLAMGGPSYHWLKEALNVRGKIFSGAKQLHVPTLILEAGQDKIVVAKAEEKFCTSVNKKAQNCAIHLYPTAFHNILMETDDIRSDAMARSLAWFGSHSN